MSTVADDEFYSNVDTIEELRNLCVERDSTISKLKLLAVRKNRTINALEEEINVLINQNKGLEATNKHLEEQVTRLSLNTVYADHIDELTALTRRQQDELDHSKVEIETLNKRNGDLLKLFDSVKCERDAFEAEIANLKADIAVFTAHQNELYAYFAGSYDSHSISPGQQHVFVMSTIKNMAGQAETCFPEKFAELQSFKREVARLSPNMKILDLMMEPSSKDAWSILRDLVPLLRQCIVPTSFDSQQDCLRSQFADIMRDRDELKHLINTFNQVWVQDLQSILEKVSKIRLRSILPQGSPRNRINCDIIANEFQSLREYLGGIRASLCDLNMAFAKDLIRVQQFLLPITSLRRSIYDEKKVKGMLSDISLIRGDMSKVSSMTDGCVNFMRNEMIRLQRIVGEQAALPSYNEAVNPIAHNTNSLESILAEVWQLKDSLSAAKGYLLEESTKVGSMISELARLQFPPAPQPLKPLTAVRARSTSNANETDDLRHRRQQETQRFDDYDRLLRDKEMEINQLRETCDRLIALHDSLKAIAASRTTDALPLLDLCPEDTQLITRLLNHSELANLELADQAKSLNDLRAQLSHTQERLLEVSANADEASVLHEKLTATQHLLVCARKDTEAAEKRAERSTDLQAETERLAAVVADAVSQRKSAEAACAAARLETETVSRRAEKMIAEATEARDVALHRLSTLHTQYEEYKIKALHMLRGGATNSADWDPAAATESSSLRSVEKERPQLHDGGLSWRYESSRLAVAEATQLRETVATMEKSLVDAAEQLAAVRVNLGATQAALDEKTEACQAVTLTLSAERARWHEEHDRLVARAREWESAASRISDLEASLSAEKRRREEELAQQAEEFQSTYGAKISDLELRLEKAESLASAVTPHHPSAGMASPQLPPQPSNLLSFHTPLQRSANSPSNDRVITRSLEDVLFGPDDGNDGDPIARPTRIDDELRTTVETLQSQLATERHNADQTRSLLVDSEATVERLNVQANLLKSEIRRLERNAVRDCHLGHTPSPSSPPDHSPPATPTASLHTPGVTRTEYLKNVIIKFLELPSTSVAERSVLVPVLSTLLALSPAEEDVLVNIARTGVLQQQHQPPKNSAAAGADDASAGSSWSSYLSSWTGY